MISSFSRLVILLSFIVKPKSPRNQTMNRLCQSSYGSLEAVINFAGCNGNPEQRLVHFYRDRVSGTWSKADMISTRPFSGGSIIQNCTKRNRNQNHGDFEVLVLEDDGLMKHYTRDNTIPVDSGKYAWQLSATVNEGLHQQYGKVVVRDAAPLYQMKSPISESSNRNFLQTALFTDNGRILHYHCPQPEEPDSKEIRHQWKFVDRITNYATGPACLYQDSEDDLKALVPSSDGIVEFSFTCGAWNRLRNIPDTSGPACIYSSNPAEPWVVYAVVRCENQLLIKSNKKNEADTSTWSTCPTQLPSPLRKLYRSSHHKEHGGNSMAIISQSLCSLGHSPNTEAIVFHPCGTGWQDRWMVLHWSRLTVTQDWVVSGVVMAEVKGMPM
ncbi:uncharacterized protein F4807DRAFT_427943 [Annulohypoxylon truncatum]|uniref:uncharacterized protein n=1 Tax=Annulohypoxylon truncatum TaxID=327061 RepID=UPI00200802E8|nr:uncharacterized protein F4807DRAFT_427943 [Annulohypoxylon truncatum]KAI1209301.1 hypothetical protein F4807DRAFT_427943 [Annulohypoxylon truncatum]